MYTVISDLLHVVPCGIEMPTLVDPVGSGHAHRRRQFTRSLRRWELQIAKAPRALDELVGFLEYAQGDTPLWFDGGGFGEIEEPALVFVGNGVDTDINLPHQNVIAASAVFYVNSGLFTDWVPLGNGVLMNKIRTGTALPLGAQLTGKYRRQFKVVLETTERPSHESVIDDRDNRLNSFFRFHYFLQEVAG